MSPQISNISRTASCELSNTQICDHSNTGNNCPKNSKFPQNFKFQSSNFKDKLSVGCHNSGQLLSPSDVQSLNTHKSTDATQHPQAPITLRIEQCNGTVINDCNHSTDDTLSFKRDYGDKNLQTAGDYRVTETTLCPSSRDSVLMPDGRLHNQPTAGEHTCPNTTLNSGLSDLTRATAPANCTHTAPRALSDLRT